VAGKQDSGGSFDGRVGDRYQIGPDLYVEFVEIAAVKEQDINAQVMQPRHMDRLTENVRGRGALEQLPYGHRPNGPGGIVEMISGHHRFRAARSAGIQVAPMIVDERPMARSEVIAKSIAHNELHGSPDQDILRQLVSMIDNVDDLLLTGLPDDMVPTYGEDDTALSLPHVEFDWQMVTLLFLPLQMEEFKAALDMIDHSTKLLGVAERDQFGDFARAVHAHGRYHNVRNLAATIAKLVQTAVREIEELTADGVEPDSSWKRTAPLTGAQLPADAALVVEEALDAVARAADLKDTDPHRKWRALELLAADYLAGSRELRFAAAAETEAQDLEADPPE
jgi:hypothetical protein